MTKHALKKKPAKKAAPKAAARSKAAAKTPAKKAAKAPVKASAKAAKTPVKRPVKAPAKRPVKAPAKIAAKTPAKKAAPAPAPAPVRARILMSKAELKEFRAHLQQLHDRVVEEIEFLASDNLNRSPREASGDLSSYSFHMADHGTDNFDREFALNLVSSGQDLLHEINDALRRIDTATYGACEECGHLIEKPRLKALPFAKMCIKCQSAAERGRERFRRFGQTISQVVEPTS